MSDYQIEERNAARLRELIRRWREYCQARQCLEQASTAIDRHRIFSRGSPDLALVVLDGKSYAVSSAVVGADIECIGDCIRPLMVEGSGDEEDATVGGVV